MNCIHPDYLKAYCSAHKIGFLLDQELIPNIDDWLYILHRVLDPEVAVKVINYFHGSNFIVSEITQDFIYIRNRGYRFIWVEKGGVCLK